MNRTRVLVILACSLAAAAAALGRPGSGKEWTVAGAAAAAGVLGLLASLLVERARSTMVSRDARAEQARNSIFQPYGRLPLVREIMDPIAIGVHPATTSRAISRRGDRIPVYVPRDADSDVRDALLTSGFILLVGEAAAGKTRTAFEAIRAVLPGHRLIAPATARDVAAAIGRARDERECVLWLDDLQAFLHGGSITRKDIAELLTGDRHYRIIMATIRTVDESRITGQFATGDRSDRLLDIGQGVLDQVRHWIFIERLFTVDEQDRARELATRDKNLAAALRHADHIGIAEYIARGPELFRQWEMAWTRGDRPRAAALIAAAVDCRRAGFTGPLPRPLLATLHEDYLRDRGGIKLMPEDIDTAWDWALSLRESGSAPLERVDADNCDVFGYLVDEYRRRHGDVVPERTVRAALDLASPVDASGIAMTAWQQGRYGLARSALRQQYAAVSRGAKPNDPMLLVLRANLAVTTLHLNGYRTGLPTAEHEFRQIIAALTAQSQTDPEYVNTVRAELANVLLARGKLAEAESEYREVIAARTATLGERHQRTLTIRNNLALLLAEMNRLEEAETEYQAILEIQCQRLGSDHPQTKVSARNLQTVLKRRTDYGQSAE